jgi:hypothetical protein
VTPFCSIALLFIRCRALTGCPDNRIKDCVEALSPPQQSLLMQYIYRGMAQRNEVTSSLQTNACSCYIVHFCYSLFPMCFSSGTLLSLQPLAKAASCGMLRWYIALHRRPHPVAQRHVGQAYCSRPTQHA